jgi:hypothetical protein
MTVLSDECATKDKRTESIESETVAMLLVIVEHTHPPVHEARVPLMMRCSYWPVL